MYGFVRQGPRDGRRWNRNVWKEVGKEYFDLTHLHGFKELSLSQNALEKIFWLTIILGAFTFTGFLVYKSIKDFNDDKKQTFVKQDRYGNISLPILYCPSHWIDLKKVAKENVPNEYLLYALSYLRTKKGTYFEDGFFHEFDYRVDVHPEAFCNESTDEPVQLPELVYMEPFIQWQCLKTTSIPYYYKELSTKLIRDNIMETVAKDNVLLMKTIFEKCLESRVDDIWKILYERFYLSLAVYPKLKTILTDNEQFDKIKSCGSDDFSVFVTLKEIDHFNFSEHVCLEQDYTDIVTSISLCGIYNYLTMYYMFNGDVAKSYNCKDCKIQFELERYRSRKFAELLVENNHEYVQFLARSNSTNSFESFKKFFNDEIGGSNYHQNVKLMEMRSLVYRQFEANEKRDFTNFLKNDSIFDLFKKAAFDKSKFLLSMSVDPVFEIRPRSGSVTVEIVTNSYGICYLFQINADMTPLTELPYVINEVDQWRRINQKLYVNIVELDIGDPISVRENDNIIVFGTSAYDLVPSKNWFKTDYVDDWESNYNQFQISNLAYQNRLGFDECREKSKIGVNVTYTYDNCLMDCLSKYTQPKYIGGDVKKPYYCEYIMENFMGDKTMTPCSFFSKGNNVTSMKLEDGLRECQQKCLIDCETIGFNTKSKIAKCDMDNYCVAMRRFSDFIVYEDTNISMEKYYVNVPEEPVWMKPFEKVDDPTVVDMINGIKRTLARPISRIEIQIDSEVTTYITSQSLVWYSYLGVVGGQINLMVSGSVITLFQLIWWISRYCYHGTQGFCEAGK